MLVPRSRLLFWVALIVLPFATLGGVAADAAPIAIAAIALFLVIVLFDAAFAFGRLDHIKIALPEVVRLSKDREGQIEVQIDNSRQRAEKVRVALGLPRELQSAQEDLVAQLPANTALSRLVWPCTPRRRGNYLLEKCYIESASALGFWAIRGSTRVQSEIRVYPNLMSERKNVATLFLNRGNFGAHAQRQVGKGRDFEKLREYIPGDSYDEIHWKATAKRGKPVTKIVDEYTDIYSFLLSQLGMTYKEVL